MAEEMPPPYPSIVKMNDTRDAAELLRELQCTFNSKETDVKRLLMTPAGLRTEVQCDVERVGSSSNYRCYVRLGGLS